MDEKKNSNSSQTTKQSEKAAPDKITGSKPVGKTRRVFSKRWMYPAIYLGAAALIIGLMYAKSQMGGGGAQPTAGSKAATTTSAPTASVTYKWPVMGSASSYKVPLGYFPVKGSEKQQASALVFYDNAYYPHEGIDIQSPTKKPFQVTAAATGVVTKVDNNKLYGNTVEVKSADGNVEYYESLGKVTVKQGDHIDAGQTIGTSGTNQFESKAGNHLYFEIEKNGQPINPTSVLPKR